MLETDKTLTAEVSLYYDLYVPDGIRAPSPLLIAVHGYGAHKRYMMREARAVASKDWVVASIQAPHQHFRESENGYRVGFGWLTDHKPEEYVRLHHDFVNRIIDKLAAENIINREQVFLYGFSQACALNFRYAFTFPERLAGVVGVCGGIPGDLDSNPNYKPFTARTLYLYGDDDEFYTQAKFVEFEVSLRDRLSNFRSKQYHAKHEITDEMRRDISSFFDR